MKRPFWAAAIILVSLAACAFGAGSEGKVYIEWQKTFGGSSDDAGVFIQQTSDGGYIVAGYTKSNNGDVSGNHGWMDFWVVKLEPVY